MEVLNIGYNNTVLVGKIIALVNADSKPARRIRELAEREGRLIDATNGRKTRAFIVTESNHIILSSASPQALAQRINEKKR